MPHQSFQNTLIGKIWKKVRHGLFLQELKTCLGLIGLSIEPYYWVQEGLVDKGVPALKGDFSGHTLGLFGPQEMKIIGEESSAYPESKTLPRLKKGQKCLGMKHNGEIVAFMWFVFDECIAKPRDLRLKENEAYLTDMYTMRDFRGRGVAPYLRYMSYKFLKGIGKDTFYSITDYFNTSSKKFKKKINAKNLTLAFYFGLFKKFHRRFIIKDY